MQFDVRSLAVPIALLLAGCAAPERRYVGAGPACGGATGPATLVRRGTEVALTPSDGAVVLRGRVDAAGQVQASWAPPARGTAASRKQPPATRTAIGTIDADGAHLRLAAPGCEAILELRQPEG